MEKVDTIWYIVAGLIFVIGALVLIITGISGSKTGMIVGGVFVGVAIIAFIVMKWSEYRYLHQ